MFGRLCSATLPLVASLQLFAGAHHAAAQGAAAAATSTSAADRRAAIAILEKWVPFAPKSATIGGLAMTFLDDKAALLRLNPTLTIRVDATGRDAEGANLATAAADLAGRRNEVVRGYLLMRGVGTTQIITPETTTGIPSDAAEERIGARVTLAGSSEAALTAITALKQTPTIVRTRPGFEVFALPRNLANDSVRILCAPPAAARLGVADTAGEVSAMLLPKALVFVARDSATIFTLQHNVSLIADPDKVDMTTQTPDPRCR